MAEHVNFHESARLEGDITTRGSDSFTIAGLPGLKFTVNSLTEVKADSGRAFNDLGLGNHM
jgi:hypothetical protein